MEEIETKQLAVTESDEMPKQQTYMFRGGA